jgi:hypothetical protein
MKLRLNLFRETSNKALAGVNQMNLIPFITSFLTFRERLPPSTVVSAGNFLVDSS